MADKCKIDILYIFILSSLFSLFPAFSALSVFPHPFVFLDACLQLLKRLKCSHWLMHHLPWNPNTKI